MNLQHLKYAREVEKCGSINNAAKNLYITQSYLSTCLKQLENDLGIVLFKRSSRGTEVTFEGREFLTLSRDLILQFEVLEKKYMKEIHKEHIFNISSIRSAVGMQTYIDFFKHFSEKENYKLGFYETGMIEMIDSVYYNTASLGVAMYFTWQKDYISNYIRGKNLKLYDIDTLPVHLITSKNHELAKNNFIYGLEVEGYPCVTYSDYMDSVLNINNECKLLGIGKPERLIYVRDRHTLLNTISCSDAYAVAHKFSKQDEEIYNLVSKPVKNIKYNVHFGCVRRESLCKEEKVFEKKFMDILTEKIQNFK